MTDDEKEVRRKLCILNHAVRSGIIAMTCRHFGIPRSLFNLWRNAYRIVSLARRGSGHTPMYNKARTPQLNGTVERSHRSDQDEFYQLLTYKDDVGLRGKLIEWEQFYNFSRPHGAHAGKTPYEALRDKIS